MKRKLLLSALGLFFAAAINVQANLFFSGKDGPGDGKHVALIAGDEEYRSEESCPMLAKILSQRHGFDCTVLFSLDPSGQYIDPNNQRSVSNIEALAKADLLIIGTRFRRWSPEEYQHLADYLNAGKPVVGFRTATHAFTGDGATGDFKWAKFGLNILGEEWVNHHGRHKVQGTRGVIESEHADHPVLNGVKDVFGPSDVYGVTHLDEDKATILLRGAVTESLDPDSDPIAGGKNDPMMPLAWLKDYTAPNGAMQGRAFCTTMGASVDFTNEDLRRLIVNVVYYLNGMDVPQRANVDYVDPFNPTFYGFNNQEDFYKNRQLKVTDFELGKSASLGTPQELQERRQREESARERRRNRERSETPTYPTPPEAENEPKPVALPIQPRQAESIAMVGNSLGERMLNFGYFEASLHQRFPNARLTLRNLCNPGDTPGFRARSSRPEQWAFPGAEQFHPDKQRHFGVGHYPNPDQWLYEVKADTILALFGYNESFDGLDRVDNFKAELAAFVDHTLTTAYNGDTAPRLVLITPIAFEDRTDKYDVPSGEKENQRLEAYAKAVMEVARAKNVGAVDVFSVTRDWFSKPGPKLTINGCHLSEEGYAKLAPVLLDALFGQSETKSKAEFGALREAVLDKDWFWFNDYRMLNGVHAYGRRYQPYGNVNYPEEVEKMRQMTRLRDERIWDLASGKTQLPPVADDKTIDLTPVETNFKKPIRYLDPDQAIEQFTMRDGYQASLFASESEFPDLKNPVQMSFDNRGRMWVSVIPSYPHYKPGDERPNDKILIFEDTNGDGRADVQKVFADGLNLPIGFEIAPEGVYVSQEPHLCLLVDEDKDDRADRLEILLTGFDTHDTHHAISAYAADASGSFYMCEGRFLHSQVETPYGPQRMTDGGVWRFNPVRYRLERYSQADYNNPWAVAFDAWDQCYISDASSGQNWWGLPVSANIPHGLEIHKVDEFAPKRARPTSGSEFVSSRHFPDDVQGHFMICNSIGFLGISLHDVWEEGSGFYGEHVGDLLSSSDPNFRPVELEFGPDGALYFIDWHNALIGHMQHSARDPNRDHDHGRIYQVTYPSRPLVKPAKIAGASVSQLLENLKLPEYRTRYRTRRELRGRPASEVLPAVKRWAASLDRSDPDYERHLCEALWATWSQNRVDRGLLGQCLNARGHQARAAAVHVIRYAYPKLSDHAAMLLRAANDPHGRVRLEAIVAASWLDNPDGARVVLETLKYPFDRWMGPVTDMILKTTLEDDLKALQADPQFALDNNPNARDYLAGKFKFEPPAETAEEKSYGPTSELSEAERKVYELGKEVFFRDGHCATCHQPNGMGMPNIYPPLAAENNPWLKDNEERLIKIVLKGLWGPMELAGQTFDPEKGVPPMPGFAFLKDEEVAAVLSYVRQSFGNDLPMIDAEKVARIRAQTEERQDFYMIEDIMKQHPIPGWEKWKKGEPFVNPYE